MGARMHAGMPHRGRLGAQRRAGQRRGQAGGSGVLPPGSHGAWVRRVHARRHAFKHIVERSGVLTSILGKSGPAAVMNMDNLLLRESMDVIGRVGFEKEMGALEDFMEGDVGSGASVDVMLRCTHEVRPPAGPLPPCPEKQQ